MTDFPLWDSRPPSAPPARILILPVGKYHAVALGPYVGCWIHWLGKRTAPCLGDKCPAARHRRTCYWCGYLPIALANYSAGDSDKGMSFSRHLLSCTDEHCRQLDESNLAAPGPVLLLSRRSNQRGFTIDTIRPLKKAPDNLPAAFDPVDVLARAWGMRRGELNGHHLAAGELPPSLSPDDFPDQE